MRKKNATASKAGQSQTPSLRAIAWQSKCLDCFVPRNDGEKFFCNDGEISSMTGEVPRNDDF